jgi:hypothetical protein
MRSREASEASTEADVNFEFFRPAPLQISQERVNRLQKALWGDPLSQHYREHLIIERDNAEKHFTLTYLQSRKQLHLP